MSLASPFTLRFLMGDDFMLENVESGVCVRDVDGLDGWVGWME